ncbi:hypothetical protein EEK90_03610 [Muribaculaceae bacterium Isolate-036 (Harlan)]|nr:hypothetical protein EEK90_03610 [Muribaculaceae bacterium Isolate-036 (Harlan)]
MKKQLITTLLLTISAGAGNAMTSENIDSLSYAYGYQYTIATMAGKNDFMQSEQDFSDYIRGLEEGNRNLTQMNDSSCIGRHVAVEIDGRFMFAPRVNQQITGGRCAISGLTSEEINLLFRNTEKDVNQHPADTIEVIEIN